jgi:hypothetical protein
MYDTDGRITGVIRTSSEGQSVFSVEHQDHKHFVKAHEIDDDDHENHRMVGGKLTKKKPFPKRFDKTRLRPGENATLRGLPASTLVNGKPFPTGDEVLHVVGYLPGEYTVVIDPFPYHKFEVTFHVGDIGA